MEPLILNHSLTQGLMIELSAQPPFLSFLHVHLVMGIVVIILASHPFKNQSLPDLFSRCQVFHRTALRISVIFLAIHYVVLLSNVEIEFPQPYVNLLFLICHLLLNVIV